MTLQSHLMARCQTGYEAQVAKICQRWTSLFGEDAFKDAPITGFADWVMDRLEASDLSGDTKRQLVGDLMSLSAWCGFETSADVYRRMGLLVRRALYENVRGHSIVHPEPQRPKIHSLFAGQFIAPQHSPTRGMVDYSLALLADPEVERLDIYHIGMPNPHILDYMRQKFSAAGDRVNLVPVETLPQILGTVAARGSSIVHFWCEHAVMPQISFLAAFRPTVMYTCADGPPYQYADVYWFFRDSAYIATAWANKGVPAPFIANYVSSPYGANSSERWAQVRRSKTEFGLSADDLLLVSVGNRLAIEMDQAFVGGLETVLRNHPQAVWLVVGPLPDNFLSAFRGVLGRQFVHVPYERKLNELLSACDIFLNPFRAGGGDSANLAMANGCVVLTRGDFGDVGGVTPSICHTLDADGYFAKLVELIQNPALRDQWRVVQTEHSERTSDQAAFTQSLRQMSDLAWARYRQRVGKPIEDLLDIPPVAGAQGGVDPGAERQTGTG
jgi:glycosyltransferase involved in cell wall biosynthesis